MSSLYSTEAFQRGGRKGAKKVMIVITDGESHDSPDLKRVIETSERENITRYAVAVSTSANSLHRKVTIFSELNLWMPSIKPHVHS